ncbi:hypothetical protein [Zoogloea sp.]|uniref:hypothetical protein n=1 Tax=Zoogloea sp. TaxID=49181 RepID=UPI0025CD9494|nr:hypothetical protein [Zoogloea sp.]MCK6395956.1 hypothetical protein [Zoogloea sp.]
MGEKALVESLVSDAIALITKLDEVETSPTFAAWYYYDDADEWRLLIASPALDPLLQKQEAVAYRKVIEVLASTSPAALNLSDLKLVATRYQLLQAVKFLVGTGPRGIARAHFKDCTVNGIFIKELVVLRSA